jgi:hypothetical protein
MPPPGPGRAVVAVEGDHSLRSDLAAVQQAVGSWLAELPQAGLAQARGSG